MKKQLLIPIFMLGILVNAQQKINKQELDKIATEEQAIYDEAKTFERNNLSEHDFGPGVNFSGFYNGIPVYLASDSQSQINSMDVDYLYNNTIPGVAVTGNGMMVYIWDGGAVRTTHREFGDRVTIVEAGSVSDHATGVAGVIISEGITAAAKGIAYEANLKSLNFTNGSTTSEMVAQSNLEANADYMVSNHSYGSLTGWYQNPSGVWYWYGYPHLSETESALFGFYHPTDATYDNIAYNAPQHTIFKSSGNNRSEGPSGPVNHYAFNETGGWVMIEDGTVRPNDCVATNGFDCLSYAGSNSKNIIIVGAINPIGGNNRYEDPSDVVTTWFSSSGPTDDGRIKPDVTAIGSGVAAPNNTSDISYTSWAGTSFSSPAAAGVGVLLQQIAKEKSDGAEYLRSDMMKGLLTHTANESGSNLGPDYVYGWGLINALSAAETFLNTNQNSYTANNLLSNNATETLTVTASGEEPLKVSITWNDPAGTPSGQVVLNDRTPKLVNDLDLRVSNGGTTYFPWKLDVENPAAAATQGDNVVDNIEQVYIENPVAGQQYTITISHKGSLTDGQQNYALVVTGVNSEMATNEVNLNQSVNVYPNPVIDNLNFQITDKLTNATVRVFNPMGQVVYQNEYKSLNNTQSIDFKSIPSGIYMVYIKSDEGTITKKVIKK
ncbi:S8 family peptidase [Moheibacter sediminis]|uniref:Por secretion system C-terminal sorting domain-containing protein n=1 Tax=Moheibacter sediminis TaxID=1434700 RepID=A0A1W1Z3V6_9FLAO|nr:S8 family peptidase [Moheibacter sediminis]SMC42982.1 Por secretion system C-terminal sorting domain-containing protein [Moheibacter sediminis]